MAVSLGINGNLGLTIIMFHGMTLLALTIDEEEMWPDALATLVVVHTIRRGKGDDNYIPIVLDDTMCHMELYAGAQERGLQFPDRFADDCEDVIVAFKIVEATMEQVNKERAKVAAKPSKRPRTKKNNAVVGA